MGLWHSFNPSRDEARRGGEAHQAIELGSNAFMKTAFFAMRLQSACAGFHVPSPLLFNDEASLHRGWGGSIFEGRAWMTRDYCW